MLLANTLKQLDLPDVKIIRMLLDKPGTDQVFSIHAICEKGRHLMKKEPGDWYGVNSIA